MIFKKVLLFLKNKLIGTSQLSPISILFDVHFTNCSHEQEDMVNYYLEDFSVENGNECC